MNKAECMLCLYFVLTVQQRPNRQTVWGSEECRTANLCKDFSQVSQQANTWAICDITCMQQWTTAALECCSLQTVSLAGQIVLQAGCHWDLTLPYGGKCTTAHYWHIPAAELHHSCSERTRLAKTGAEVALRLERWAVARRLPNAWFGWEILGTEKESQILWPRFQGALSKALNTKML